MHPLYVKVGNPGLIFLYSVKSGAGAPSKTICGGITQRNQTTAFGCTPKPLALVAQTTHWTHWL